MRLIPSSSSGHRSAAAATRVPARDPFRYRALFELAPDGFVVTDRASAILESNRAAGALLGRPADELSGRLLTALVAPHERRGFEARFARVKEGRPERRAEWEVRIETEGARAFDAALAVAAIPEPRAPGGQLFHWTLRDVTKRRSLYREVLAHRDRLRELQARYLKAREEEARRIAHQLHDEAAQITASIHLALDALARAPGDPRRELARGHALLDGLEARLRELSHELRPTVLDDLGLLAALGFLAEGFTTRTGIPVEIEGVAGDSRLSPLQETALYRIVQEALANVARHARARRVCVRIGRRRRRLTCLLRDDGIGFDPSAQTRDGGLGLLGIRERLDALGGRLEVRSARGRGTELRVSIPLKCPTGSCSPKTTS